MGLRVLVIGGGGREHALAWALAQSPNVSQIYVAPGNAGTNWAASACHAPVENVAIADSDTAGLIAFAQAQNIDLTVVGPEAPLAIGVVDAFQAQGLRIFGPSQAAAQLEASKAFTKTFLRDHNIPTGDFALFTEYEPAREYVLAKNCPLVIKADGLAAGKGVIVCDTAEQAIEALQRILGDREFGDAGTTVLVEERLSGPEVSLLAFSDGKTVVPMPAARDHKRVFDNDQGPNTGGMGAYAPVPDLSAEQIAEITRTILQPTVDGMAQSGIPYVGVLYAGLMLTQDGPKVLEYNCRFGDPETQVILPLLETPLDQVFQACIDGTLDQISITWHPGACATVVLASPGYPGSYPKGLEISGLDHDIFSGNELIAFHAGTAQKDGAIVTNGGRVLAVSGRGLTLKSALKCAYSGVEQVSFEGAHYRRDIGGHRSEA